jgi:hypothetical protein
MSGLTGVPLLSSSSAPGNYLFENVQSLFAPTTNNQNVVGSVFYAEQGSLIPKLFTNPDAYILEYGSPDPTINLASYCNINYLASGFPVIAKRVTSSDASYSWSSYLGYNNHSITPPNVVANSTLATGVIIPYQSLTLPDYSAAAPTIYGIEFVNPTELTSVQITFTYQNSQFVLGPITPVGSAPFSLSQLIAPIENYINNLPGVTPETSAGFVIANTNSIFIVMPSGIQLQEPPTGNVAPSPQTDSINIYSTTPLNKAPPNAPPPPAQGRYLPLFNVYAKGPGSYYSNFSYSISNVDMGVGQQYEINFEQPPSPYDQFSFSFDFNGVTFSGSSATGLPGLIAAIQAVINESLTITPTQIPPGCPDSYTYALSQVNFTGSSAVIDLQLNPDAPTASFTMGLLFAYPSLYTNSGPLQNISIQSTTNTGAIYINQTQNQIASSYTFNFSVYISGNSNPVETFLVSFGQQTSASGGSLFLESVVNDEYVGSKYIRVSFDPDFTISPTAFLIYAFYYNLNTYLSSSASLPVYINAGENGTLPSSVDIATGYNDFQSKESVKVNILIDGGYNTAQVQQAMTAIVDERMDCETVFSAPVNLQSDAQGLAAYIRNGLDISSSRASMFAPDIKINDPYTGQAIFIPPCGLVAAQFTYVDLSVGPFQAPAGNIYGQLSGIIGLREVYDSSDRGILNSVGVNVIKQNTDGKFVIFGAKTLLQSPSLLQYLPVRRIFTFCEVEILRFAELIDFQNISPTLMQQVSLALKSFFKYLMSKNAIQNYFVNIVPVNTAQYQNNGQFNIQFGIAPFVPAQYAVLNASITDTNLTFTETTVGNL